MVLLHTTILPITYNLPNLLGIIFPDLDLAGTASFVQAGESNRRLPQVSIKCFEVFSCRKVSKKSH